MKTNYYSFADQTRYDYELKKRWRKGFEFHIEYGSISSLGYKLGYDFSACFNEYVFKKSALTIEEAELLTYQDYRKKLPRLCKKNHKCSRNCDRRGYTNGCGFCKTCNLFVSNIFSIEQFCHGCKERTNWHSLYDLDESIPRQWWCEKCYETLPESLKKL